VIPFCGVPEAVLTDRGTDLLFHLMLDVCFKLGITKLNVVVFLNMTVWSNGLTVPLRVCFENMLTSLEHSGISEFL